MTTLNERVYVWARDARTRLWHVIVSWDESYGRNEGRSLCGHDLRITGRTEYTFPAQPYGAKCHNCLRELNKVAFEKGF